MISTKIYFHTDKESMAEKGQEIGLTGKALDEFVYTGYEVGLSIEVNEKTGKAVATHFQGSKLDKKVAV